MERFGTHRSLEPAGALPQQASRLDAISPLTPDEVAIELTDTGCQSNAMLASTARMTMCISPLRTGDMTHAARTHECLRAGDVLFREGDAGDGLDARRDLRRVEGVVRERRAGGEGGGEGSGQSSEEAETGTEEGESGGAATETGPPWTYQMARIIIVLSILLGLAIMRWYWKLVGSRQRTT